MAEYAKFDSKAWNEFGIAVLKDKGSAKQISISTVLQKW